MHSRLRAVLSTKPVSVDLLRNRRTLVRPTAIASIVALVTATIFTVDISFASGSQRPVTLDREATRAGAGALVIVGGGGTPTVALEHMLELAGGKNAKVVVCPFASKRDSTGPGTAEMWREAGAKRVAVMAEGDLAGSRRILSEADIVWFTGGDQNRLMDVLKSSKLEAVVRERHRQGTIIGGTSAGAAVMSTSMMTGDENSRSVDSSSKAGGRGLGLWPGVIVDQHFVKRSRSNRLLSAVLAEPSTIGIGIDERTAVVVTNPLAWAESSKESPPANDPDDAPKKTPRRPSFEVIGSSNVMVFDARRSVVDSGSADTPTDARFIALHVVAAGQSFELAPSRPMEAVEVGAPSPATPGH